MRKAVNKKGFLHDIEIDKPVVCCVKLGSVVDYYCYDSCAAHQRIGNEVFCRMMSDAGAPFAEIVPQPKDEKPMEADDEK